LGKYVLDPLGDRILAKQIDAKKISEGGIIIPGKAQEKPKEAIVVSIGPGKRLEDGSIVPIQVNEGDRIVFASYAGQTCIIDDEEYLLLGQEEILARVKEVGDEDLYEEGEE